MSWGDLLSLSFLDKKYILYRMTNFLIVCRKQWDAIHKGADALIVSTYTLILHFTNKLGAPSETEINEMIDKLQSVHRMNYQGMYLYIIHSEERKQRTGSIDTET